MFSRTEITPEDIHNISDPFDRILLIQHVHNLVYNNIYNVWYQSDIEVYLKLKKFV